MPCSRSPSGICARCWAIRRGRPGLSRRCTVGAIASSRRSVAQASPPTGQWRWRRCAAPAPAASVARGTLSGGTRHSPRCSSGGPRHSQGTRQVGVIAGEPGIGKTALVEAFLAQVAASGACRVGHGQCVEPYGPGEPYLPVLEALGRLGREPDGATPRGGAATVCAELARADAGAVAARGVGGAPAHAWRPSGPDADAARADRSPGCPHDRVPTGARAGRPALE